MCRNFGRRPTGNLPWRQTAPTLILCAVRSQGRRDVKCGGPGKWRLVLLSGNNGKANVSETMTIPAGATSGTFTISTILYINPFTFDVTAGYGGVTANAVLSFTPSNAPAELGKTASLTVTLTNTAPAHGAVVTLTSSNPALVKVPASIKILSVF